jgi:hypothetical protein
MKNKILLMFALLLTLSGCMPNLFVKPLAKKEKSIAGSFGGPMITNLGFPIPIPFLTANYGYGIDSSKTLFGGLNLTSLAFGNVQTQLGITQGFFQNKNKMPGVSATLQLNTIYRNSKNLNFYPQIDVNAWWDFGKEKQNYVYVGISNWIEPKAKRAHNEPQINRILVSPQVGVRLTKNSWQYSIETKLIAPTVSNKDIVVSYVSPLPKTGAVGVYFGISKIIK